MKHFLIIMIALFACSFIGADAVKAQAPGTVITAVDTSKSATAVNIPLVTTFKSKNTLVIQALCTQLGGTTEGKLYLEASLDGTSYETLTETSGLLKGFPNDTLTMTNGAVGIWVLEDTPWLKYRMQATGGSGDTTKITVKYVFK